MHAFLNQRLPHMSLMAVSMAVCCPLALSACTGFDLCPQRDDDTVALYRLDEQSGQALHTSGASSSLQGWINDDAVARDRGPCGGALSFPATSWTLQGETQAYAYLPSDPVWQLSEGSVDLWIRLESVPQDGVYGVLSRDADQTTASPGHLSLFRLREQNRDYLALRILEGASKDGGTLCTQEPIEDDYWHHVAFNFGGDQPAELFVDGVRSNGGGASASGPVICGTPSRLGIDDTDEPWVLGALGLWSEGGRTVPSTGGFGGSIATLRISQIRRVFTR